MSTVATPVLSRGCGSVESLVWLLARELTRLGHEVTTFATDSSDPPGELVPTLPGPYATAGSPDDWQACEWINLTRAVEQSERFDVIHAHAYLWGVPLARVARCPMVHTTHVFPDDGTAALWRLFPDAHVTAVSEQQWAEFPDLRPAAVVPHGVDPALHTFRPEPDDYLLFLGRFNHEKGALKAIEVARSLDMRLVLAGPSSPYFRDRVRQHVDGKRVEYVGPVNVDERDGLLGGARALLYPVMSPEPFGLVMPEAMMSGTPVAAFAIGAVPGIVDDGVTGFVTPAGGDLAAAAERCLSLDRSVVYARARERFGVDQMARSYAALYDRVAQEAACVS